MIAALLARLDPVLGTLKAVFIVAFTLGTFWLGHYFTALQYQEKIDKSNVAAVVAVRDKEHEMQGKIDALTTQSQKDKQDADDKYNALAASYRDSSNRLRVAVAKCDAPNPGDANQQTNAELLPAVAANLIEYARDADDTVRDLNQCVDQYNAVRDSLTAKP